MSVVIVATRPDADLISPAATDITSAVDESTGNDPGMAVGVSAKSSGTTPLSDADAELSRRRARSTATTRSPVGHE